MQKYYNSQNFSKSLQSFCDRLFNCESTLCLERGVNRAYGNFVGNQPMLVNVCDLEPVPGAATLYWASWSGSLYPFIFSPNVAGRLCLRELALFLVTSCSKWIYPFKEEINLAFGWILYM